MKSHYWVVYFPRYIKNFKQCIVLVSKHDTFSDAEAYIVKNHLDNFSILLSDYIEGFEVA